jgi:hypothetical protein
MSTVRATTVAGAIYGVSMGAVCAFIAWSKGASPLAIAAVGFGSGLGCGALFGLLMYGFTRWSWVRRQIALQPGELLPGERLVERRLANLVVDPRVFGLRPFALGDLMFLAGLQDKEVIGGALYLTNLRLLFKAHRVNRLLGAVSVFLPSVQRLEARSRWPFRRLRVGTRLLEVEFVVNDVEGIRDLIERARSEFSSADEAQIQTVRDHLPGLTQLQPNATLNALNTAIHGGRLAADVTESVLTPLSALAGLLASEVFDHGFAERWSERMR